MPAKFANMDSVIRLDKCGKTRYNGLPVRGLISWMDRESELYRSGQRTGGTDERTQSVFGPDIIRIDRRRSV